MADVIISRNAMFLVDEMDLKKIEESVQKITTFYGYGLFEKIRIFATKKLELWRKIIIF